MINLFHLSGHTCWGPAARNLFPDLCVAVNVSPNGDDQCDLTSSALLNAQRCHHRALHLQAGRARTHTHTGNGEVGGYKQCSPGPV